MRGLEPEGAKNGFSSISPGRVESADPLSTAFGKAQVLPKERQDMVLESIGCLDATRDITQGSLGYIYRIYSGPAGRLQYGLAYSYLARSAWFGVGGAPKATNNFVYASFRYYLP